MHQIMLLRIKSRLLGISFATQEVIIMLISIGTWLIGQSQNGRVAR